MIISCIERRGKEDVGQEKSEYTITLTNLANPSGIKINHRVPLWVEIARH